MLSLKVLKVLKIKLFVHLLIALVMPVLWPEFPCVFVSSLHIVDAYVMQDFLQVILEEEKTASEVEGLL